MIVLPWPPKELLPNARRRNHWATTAVKTSAYKRDCLLLAKGSTPRKHLDITFMPPDKRKRDLDGMLSAAKPALDALAQVWKIDDYEFSISMKRGDPVKHGKVIIE
jgi:crossover junction endodeoxyribonuclease RusA